MKHLRTIAALTILSFLVGCGGKPSTMDSNTYDLGCKALEIMDSYNKMETDKDSTSKQLEEIYNRLDGIEYDDEHFSESLQNGLVTAYILSYKISMTSGNGLFEEADKLRETLNK